MKNFSFFLLVSVLLSACEFKISLDKNYDPVILCAVGTDCPIIDPYPPFVPEQNKLVGSWRSLEEPSVDSCGPETIIFRTDPTGFQNYGTFQKSSLCSGSTKEGNYSLWESNTISFTSYLPYPEHSKQIPEIYACSYQISEDNLTLDCRDHSKKVFQRVVQIDDPIPAPKPPALPFFYTQCDSDHWQFDVYLVSSKLKGGSYDLLIMPFFIDTPGDIASVTVGNQQNGYKQLVSQVVLNKDHSIEAGVLTQDDLSKYPILAITSYNPGGGLPSQLATKASYCELKIPGGELSLHQN